MNLELNDVALVVEQNFMIFEGSYHMSNCATEFDPEQLLKSRKGRVSSKSAVIEVVKKEKDEEDFQDNTLDESELILTLMTLKMMDFLLTKMNSSR